MKKYFVFVLLILLVLWVSACNVKPPEKSPENPTPTPIATPLVTPVQSPEPTPTIDSKYEIVETNYEQADIQIIYPQLKGLADSAKQKTINALLKKAAMDPLQYLGDDVSGITYQIGYQISCQTANVLSIIFTGYFDSETAAHPSNSAFAIVIDIKKAAQVRLSDLVHVNKTFVNKLLSGKFIAISSPEHQEEIRSNSAEDLIDLLNDTAPKGACNAYYLTDNSLGLIVSVSHVAGDYAQFEMSYAKMQADIVSGNGLIPPQ